MTNHVIERFGLPKSMYINALNKIVLLPAYFNALCFSGLKNVEYVYIIGKYSILLF